MENMIKRQQQQPATTKMIMGREVYISTSSSYRHLMYIYENVFFVEILFSKPWMLYFFYTPNRRENRKIDHKNRIEY